MPIEITISYQATVPHAAHAVPSEFQRLERVADCFAGLAVEKNFNAVVLFVFGDFIRHKIPPALRAVWSRLTRAFCSAALIGAGLKTFGFPIDFFRVS